MNRHNLSTAVLLSHASDRLKCNEFPSAQQVGSPSKYLVDKFLSRRRLGSRTWSQVLQSCQLSL